MFTDMTEKSAVSAFRVIQEEQVPTKDQQIFANPQHIIPNKMELSNILLLEYFSYKLH
jgi:hypothetical protein